MDISSGEFLNIYIQTLVKEIEEMTKQKMVLMAKETFATGQMDDLKRKNNEMENEIQDFSKSIDELRTENDKVQTQNDKLKADSGVLKAGILDGDNAKRELEQTKVLLKSREVELEEKRHKIIELTDKIKIYEIPVVIPKPKQTKKNSSKQTTI